MHKDVLHRRLISYMDACDFEAETFENGFYRFQLVIQISDEKDQVTIKQAKFNKFLGFAHPVTGKQITESQAFKNIELNFWAKYKDDVLDFCETCFKIVITSLLGAIFYGCIYG